MTQKKPVALIGRLAVQLKLITMDQLAQATSEQARTGKGRLGEIFCEMGFINDKQMKKLETVQKDLVAKHRAKQATRGAAALASEPPGRSVPGDVVTEPATARRSKQEVLETAAQAASDASPVTSSVVEEIAQAPPKVAGAAAQGARPAAAPGPSASPAPPLAAAPQPVQEQPAAPVSQPTAAAQPVDGSPSLELSLPAAETADRSRLQQILADALEAGASDVHIHSGGAIKLRVNGELKEQGSNALSQDEAARMVSAALSEQERREICVAGEIDFCFDIKGVGRFRANAYRQQRGFDAVFRSISPEPPTLDELGLPHELAKYANYHQGMVLLTGPAGCGKSATMAALVNLINEEREEHILTIEDPIEVLHPAKRCLVNQRHAGRHTSSFARALRGALREDPDVIVIGELRDIETISLAMTAAETGHFVLATLHTNNAVRTINRMIGVFPSNEQGQVRTMLSESLRAVISQRLVPVADGSGRVPALEMLVINKAIGNLIRDEKTVQIRSSIQTGKAHGMYLLEQSLNDMVQAGTITRDVALKFAEEKKLVTAGG